MVTRTRVMRMLASSLAVLACALVPAGSIAADADFLTGSALRSDGAAVAQPAVAAPALGASYVDPVFGTTVRRITAVDPPGVGGTVGVVPEYPKAQAWNADMTRLLLRGTDASWHLYDGQTFAGPLPSSLPVGDIEPRWSRTDPDTLTYLVGRSVRRYSVSARTSSLVGRFPELGEYITSGSEQETSADGRYFAVHGPLLEGEGGATISFTAAVIDLSTGTRGPLKTIRRPPGNPNDFLDYVAITPNGGHVMVMWAYHGADLYRRSDWVYARRLTSWDEHGDFCRDRDGRWWFVQARYRPVENDEVVQASSPGGFPRRTLWRAPRFNLALHISCRNTRMPGWAYVSSYWDGLGQRPGGDPTPFENEVFALGLDSTPSAPVVRRLAHTRMTERADYFDEPHATVRQDGRVVLLASNFGASVADEGYVDTYAVDLRP